METEKTVTAGDAEWIPFSGDITEKQDTYHMMIAGGGVFSVKKDDVKLGEVIHIRNHSAIDIITEPQGDPGVNSELAACNCAVKIPATGREEKIPKYGCETKCWGVVLVCYYCVYNPAGVYTRESSNICGGCIGIPF